MAVGLMSKIRKCFPTNLSLLILNFDLKLSETRFDDTIHSVHCGVFQK